MRLVNVIGVMSLGLGVGTAAVLAPLWLTSMGAGSTTSPSDGSANHWIGRAGQLAGQVGSAVAGAYADLTTAPPPNQRGNGPSAADANAVASADQDPAPRGQQPRTHGAAVETFGYLTHAPRAAAAKITEPSTVQKPWTTQVTVETETASGRKQTSSKPTSEDQRRTLVRDIQTELKRVGCFDGDADGTWSAASKRAMASFTQRVNASLPFEQPDFILLTLVQGHTGTACGKACANGQTLSDGGRCLSTGGLVAQADHAKDKLRTERADAPAKTADKIAELPTVVRPSVGSAWTATVTGPVTRPLTTGSIVAAVPTPAQRPAVRRGTDVAAAATPEPSSSAVAREPIPSLPRSAERSPTPLPGRMTIGGPAVVPTPDVTAPPTAASNGPKPTSTKPQVATLDVAKPTPSVPTPVTEIDADDPPPQRATRSVSAATHAPVAARPKHDAPAPTVVHRPVPTRPVSSAPPKEPQFGSKQRRLVYEMFQRPDRN